MLIRGDFKPKTPLPPRLFLEQVMNDLTKAYCFLWDHKNPDNEFHMSWKELSIYYNKNSFRSNIRKLNNQGLLNYEEAKEGIFIELIGWDEVAEAHDD